MNELNPYQSPDLLADDPIDQAEELYASGRCWRDGKYLVTTLNSRLPARCVHYNDEATNYEKIQLTWYPSWILFTLLLGPLFLIALVLMGTRISVDVPTGARLQQRLAISSRWTWGFIFSGAIVALGGYVLLFSNHDLRSLFVVGGIMLMLTGVVIGTATSKKLVIQYADRRFVWLRGAGEPFLTSLPAWPLKRPWL